MKKGKEFPSPKRRFLVELADFTNQCHSFRHSFINGYLVIIEGTCRNGGIFSFDFYLFEQFVGGSSAES